MSRTPRSRRRTARHRAARRAAHRADHRADVVGRITRAIFRAVMGGYETPPPAEECARIFHSVRARVDASDVSMFLRMIR